MEVEQISRIENFLTKRLVRIVATLDSKTLIQFLWMSKSTRVSTRSEGDEHNCSGHTDGSNYLLHKKMDNIIPIRNKQRD